MKLEGRNHIAVFYDGERISGYNYTNTKTINNYLIACNTVDGYDLLDIYNPNGKCIFTSNLKLVSRIVSTNIPNADEHFVVRDSNGKSGVLRYDGQFIIPFLFDKIYLFFNAIVVENNKRYGLYSYDGVSIVPVQYDFVDCISKSGIIVSNGSKYGLYSYDGEMLFDVKYNKIYFSSDEKPICL